ncbi:hypothetical protein HK098_001811 [Nowakowskiella sp. JEL0407]|nr:hypothetical protein HK098_001811 [Nowakowskiella sp. JEL0407]
MEIENKTEITRLLLQSLTSLSYKESFTTLQSESGILLENSQIQQLKEHILQGDWSTVSTLLASLHTLLGENLSTIKFLTSQQKYLELITQNELIPAMKCLREELTPVSNDPSRIHYLSSLLFRPDFEVGNVGGDIPTTRGSLLTVLQNLVSPLMVPDNRLLEILEEYKTLVKLNCLYHLDSKIDLFKPHKCLRSKFPTRTSRVLKHDDEVWYVTFSPNGKYLASASKDGTIKIWDTKTWTARELLFDAPPTYLAFSPNNKYLLANFNDPQIQLIDVESAEVVKTFSKHLQETTTCSWMPDSMSFISGAADRQMILWNISGSVEFIWNHRGQDLAISRDGKLMVSATSQKLSGFSLVDKSQDPVFTVPEKDEITSLTFSSSDSGHLLVKLSNHEVHLWSIPLTPLTNGSNSGKSLDILSIPLIAHHYVEGNNEEKEKFVVRCCFGGGDDSVIISGSGDSNVYIWNKEKEVLLECLSGHSKCVNSVAWNSDKPMIASGSDDATIRIWEPEESVSMELDI